MVCRKALPSSPNMPRCDRPHRIAAGAEVQGDARREPPPAYIEPSVLAALDRRRASRLFSVFLQAWEHRLQHLARRECGRGRRPPTAHPRWSEQSAPEPPAGIHRLRLPARSKVCSIETRPRRVNSSFSVGADAPDRRAGPAGDRQGLPFGVRHAGLAPGSPRPHRGCQLGAQRPQLAIDLTPTVVSPTSE